MTESSVPRTRPPKPRRTRGSVYRRGRRYWIQFYVPGEPKPRREPARTESYKAAEDLLTLRLGALAKGEPIIPRVDRITYDELAADLRLHFQTTGCRDLTESDFRFARLGAFFAGRKATTIGQPEATAYAARRQADGAANGTINTGTRAPGAAPSPRVCCRQGVPPPGDPQAEGAAAAVGIL
jgi:hypothetical protein